MVSPSHISLRDVNIGLDGFNCATLFNTEYYPRQEIPA